MSRRGFLGSGLAAAAALSLGGVSALLKAVPASANTIAGPLVRFQGIPMSDADTVVVPPGYTAEVLIAWGDPVSNGPAFAQDASNSAADQALQWGSHSDGLVYFPIDGSRRGLLVENNEYTDDGLLFPDGAANWNEEKTNKSINAHGVSIIEIRRDLKERRWRVVRPSKYARRITGQTPIKIGGPAAGDPRLCTSDDPTGKLVLGTLNNCAMGFTPWGTYLTCEENFNGFFQKTLANRTSLELRYGISTTAGSARPPVDAVNPRVNNVYGHIITWKYDKDWTEPDFEWDIFALCGDPAVPAHGSTIVGDKFGSPDGIYVAPSSRLWIQTDVSASTINTGDYAGFGNNQMLCADPATGEIRRFLVGPKLCEITGVTVTPDEKTMFVGIQHPGESPDDSPTNPANPKGLSSWPDGDAGGRPRSSCIVITKDDGGEIGS
jgi:secreted PhoX family phosphatase